ncbi:alpha/beta hydrolase [Methanobacterium sp. YSL]|nr:alpha/beta hydrolase [Methanobacterium sp. YSL]
MRKWVIRLTLIFTMFFVFFVVLFYRRDYSNAYVHSLYLLDQSHLMDLSIDSLDGDPLTIETHYMDFGDPSQPVIVLLHGAFSSSHTFIPWALKLSERYRVILMDLPYFGLTGQFEDHLTSYRRSAALVKSLLDELDITSVHIGGNSLGGAVAWYFAGIYPEMTESLLLIDAVPPVLERRSFGLLSQPWLAGILSQFTPRFLIKRLLSTAYGDSTQLTDDIVDRYHTILRKAGTRKAILTTKSEPVTNAELMSVLENVTAPTFVIWGKQDTWIPIATLEIFKIALNISDTNIHVFPDLGHLPMEESPAQSLVPYQTFLDSIL